MLNRSPNGDTRLASTDQLTAGLRYTFDPHLSMGGEYRYRRREAGPGTPAARWYVDGARYAGTRWTLVPGTHRIRALGAGGQHAEISITVE